MPGTGPDTGSDAVAIPYFYHCDSRDPVAGILQGFKRLGEPRAVVEYDPMDLLKFIIKKFGPLNAMMARAGMGEMDFYNRTRDVFHYFNLPYDAPPPEG